MVFESKTNSDLHAKKNREKSLAKKSEGFFGLQAGGNYFFPTLVFESKSIDHNSGRHSKNQGEISKNEVRRPPPFVWKCGHSPLNSQSSQFKNDIEIKGTELRVFKTKASNSLCWEIYIQIAGGKDLF